MRNQRYLQQREAACYVSDGGASLSIGSIPTLPLSHSPDLSPLPPLDRGASSHLRVQSIQMLAHSRYTAGDLIVIYNVHDDWNNARSSFISDLGTQGLSILGFSYTGEHLR